MKRKGSLMMKFAMGFLMIGIATCIAITVNGYEQYKSYIQKKYNDKAYDIAEIFESYMTEEEIALYMDTAEGYFNGTVSQEELESVKNSQRYKETKALLHSLRVASNVNDIYMIYFDEEEIVSCNAEDTEYWVTSIYIFDCYMVEELKYDFGEVGDFESVYIKSVLEVLETGKRTDNYDISESVYGYNLSTGCPIVVDGEVRGIIGVEIPMSTLESELNEYVVNSVLATAVVVIIFISAFMVYMYRSLISPIHLIAHEAEQFVESNAEVSDKLESIKTKDEIQKLSESILKMEIGIKEYIANITKITAEKERIGAELNVATQIQADMLPSIFPAFPERKEFDIYASMIPAKEVGGDFYDFFMVGEDYLVSVIADVSGKGVPAALFMVITKTLIKNSAERGLSPKEILEQVNYQLCQNNKEEMFVTVWLGKLELSTGKLVCANAGHDDPVVVHKNGELSIFQQKHGFVLAGMETARYREQEFMLEPGDKLFVYTDGVSEATNVSNELYGKERILKVLKNTTEDTTAETIHKVKEDMDVFVGEAPQFDDITMLCLHYQKES